MQSGARSVTTNQDGLYKNLESIVRKYANTNYLRPIANHTQDAFNEAQVFIDKFYGSAGISKLPKAVILDSGCGTGESTLHLAQKFKDIPVIGIDKSAMRIDKANQESSPSMQISKPENIRNAFWVRAELQDFWRLALEKVKSKDWTIPQHTIYYPNPWPKQSEATRRFHLHPIFPTILALSHATELRTNWEIYAREFTESTRIAIEELCEKDNPFGEFFTDCSSASIDCEPFYPDKAETAFERKYKNARQQLWRVIVKR